MLFWTAEPMTAQGPTKRRILLIFYAERFLAQPARLVRGSSRRIMSMRFRPANIRVIHRRVCSSAVIGSAVQNKTCSKPTSGNVFPLRRPSTVLPCQNGAQQSRIRFAAPKSGAPLTAARRSGRIVIATGGSGRNTSRPVAHVKNKSKKRQARTRLDRVAPYQNRNLSPN